LSCWYDHALNDAVTEVTRRKASGIRGDDGQALVEFALALPLLVLFLFGIIYFAEALNYWNTETNAVNVAARYVSVIGNQTSDPTCTFNGTTAADNVTAYAVCKGATGASVLNNGCAKVVDLTSAGAFKSGDQVQVTMKYNDAIPAIGNLFGPVSIPITSSATMMLETTPTAGSAQANWLSNGSTTLSC
jgi:Flp pilus assembly protein TadG